MEQSETYPRSQANRYKSLWLTTLGCGLLAFVLMFALPSGLWTIGLGILGFILLFMSVTYRTEYVIWDSGAQGEELVISVLEDLGEDYRVYHDVVLPSQEQGLDHVVIGPSGVYVIETKSHNGDITCIGDEWEQIKTGRGGTRYLGHLGSPSKQAKRGATWLRQFYRDAGVDPGWITAVVLFTNPEVSVELNSPTVEVLVLEDLLEFFAEREGRMPDRKVTQLAEAMDGRVEVEQAELKAIN